MLEVGYGGWRRWSCFGGGRFDGFDGFDSSFDSVLKRLARGNARGGVGVGGLTIAGAKVAIFFVSSS